MTLARVDGTQDVEELVGEWTEESSFSQPRVLKITSHRIAIIEGETNTTTSSGAETKRGWGRFRPGVVC